MRGERLEIGRIIATTKGIIRDLSEIDPTITKPWPVQKSIPRATRRLAAQSDVMMALDGIEDPQDWQPSVALTPDPKIRAQVKGLFETWRKETVSP